MSAARKPQAVGFARILIGFFQQWQRLITGLIRAALNERPGTESVNNATATERE